MVIKRYQKFVGWKDKKAYFKNATLKDRIHSWWHYLFTTKPDPKNIIIDFKEADKILAEVKRKENLRYKWV